MSEIITLSPECDSIKYLVNKDKRLAKVINMVGDISYKPYTDSYSFLVNQIIGQMLSAKVGDVISRRLWDLCNGSITPQTIANLSDIEIKSIGTSNSKVRYIRELTNAVLSDQINFDELSTLKDEAIVKKLTSIYGIGKWSAKMYLIFVLNRQDVLPYEDVAFLQAYCWVYKTDDKKPMSIIKKCRKWKPYSSIASRYMYKALDMGLTKNEFHLYK